jgi:hypothetical protein
MRKTRMTIYTISQDSPKSIYFCKNSACFRCYANLVCPKRISDYSPNPIHFDMTHSSANDIAALPRHKLTTLDNGLVRRAKFRRADKPIASRLALC